MKLSLQKKKRFNAIFHKPRHPGRLKKQIWVKKSRSRGSGHMRKNA